MSAYLKLGGMVSGSGYLPESMFRVPHRSSLAGAWSFAEGADVAARNWATGNIGVWIGAPVVGVGHMRLSPDGYLQTGVADAAAMTIFSVSRNVDQSATGTVGAIASTYLSSADAGIMLMYAGSDGEGRAQSFARVGRADGSMHNFSVAGVSTETSKAWEAVSLRVPATGTWNLRNHTAGRSATATVASGRQSSTGRLFRIGATLGISSRAPVDLHTVLIYKGDLGESAMAEVYEWAKGAAVDYGLTI